MTCRFGIAIRTLKRSAACAILSLLFSASSSALTQIDFISDPGDYIGGGQAFTLTLGDGAITTLSGNPVRIVFGGIGPSPKTNWDFNLAGPNGALLVPGNYQSVDRFQSAKRPALDVFGDGRGCNTVTGKFTVYEAVFDATGNLLAFAADAEQHCEGASAALHLRIRFNSNVPLQLQLPQALPGLPQEVYEQSLVTLDGSESYDPDGHIVSWQWSQIGGPAATIESPETAATLFRAPTVDPGGADLAFQLVVKDDSGHQAAATTVVHVFDRHDRRNLLVWRSPPGDYIGGGVPLMFTSADGAVTLGNAYQGQLSVQANFVGGSFDTWSLAFAAPNGGPLVAGTYLNAQRFPFQSAGLPGLSIDGAGRGCNTLAGSFTVLEIDQPLTPTQFGARFVQSCEEFMPPLRGTVLVNASAQGNPLARITGSTSALPGTTAALDGSSSSSTGSSLVAYKWRQLAGAPVAIDDAESPRITFTVPLNANGILRFELEVDDEDGLVDVAQFALVGGPTDSVAIPVVGHVLALALAIALGVSALLFSRRTP